MGNAGAETALRSGEFGAVEGLSHVLYYILYKIGNENKGKNTIRICSSSSPNLKQQWNQMFQQAKYLGSRNRWYVNLPDAGFEAAWKQFMDPDGFYAPWGPTTAERRDPKFTLAYKGHECQWNGPSWPMSTSITLTAMANLLQNYRQQFVSKRDYLNILQIYAKSQHLKRDDGTVVPWIDEDLNPLTGDWIARTILKSSWANAIRERGKDYNHSTYCDLIITGLAGLRPRADEVIEVKPLVPDGTWDYFCLDNVLYHGRTLTILYDKSGNRYKKGKGLRVLANGKQVVVR